MRFSIKNLSLTILITSIALTGCQSTKSGKFFGKNQEDITSFKAKNSEQGYYQEALTHIEKGNFAKAVATLNDLRTFYPAGEYSEQALLDLMYAQFQQGEYLDAVASSERFIQLYPTNPQIGYAYYVRGVANMQTASLGILKYAKLNTAHRDTGYYKIAFNNFQELINKYPTSQYAPDSALRMQYIYNQLAESEMQIARWYIKRKAYLASANRAKWVFQYYPQSPAVPEAIATLAYNYDKLGMTDTAEQYKQLLKINYPNLLTSNGKVVLENSRSASDWLNKISLGVLGKSQKTQLNTTNEITRNIAIATKPQIIQSVQQAMQLQLPSVSEPVEEENENVSETENKATETKSKKVNFGLDLPDNQ